MNKRELPLTKKDVYPKLNMNLTFNGETLEVFS